MKISIAMTTFNGQNYLQEQLSSFVEQSRLPDELVVCDDVSSDATVEILRKFSESAPFKVILVCNKKNIGHSRNFEKAVLLCTGDLIFLSDQDDVWKKEKIQNIENIFLADESVQIVASDAIIVDEMLVSSGTSVLQQTISLTGGSDEFIHGCCTAFRKSFREICFPLPVEGLDSIGHDGWLHNVGNYLGVRKVVSLPYQYYRRHQSNVSNSKTYDRVRLSYRDLLINLFCKFLKFVKNDAGHLLFLESARRNIIELEKRIIAQNLIQPNETTGSYIALLCKLKWGFNTRINLAKMNRVKRFFIAVNFYFHGGYKLFSGWKSFLVDILKPSYKI